MNATVIENLKKEHAGKNIKTGTTCECGGHVSVTILANGGSFGRCWECDDRWVDVPAIEDEYHEEKAEDEYLY